MKDDYTTQFSPTSLIHFFLKGWENDFLNLGVKGCPAVGNGGIKCNRSPACSMLSINSAPVNNCSLSVPYFKNKSLHCFWTELIAFGCTPRSADRDVTGEQNSSTDGCLTSSGYHSCKHGDYSVNSSTVECCTSSCIPSQCPSAFHPSNQNASEQMTRQNEMEHVAEI